MNAAWFDAPFLLRTAIALLNVPLADPGRLKKFLAHASVGSALFAVLLLGFTTNAFAVATGCRGDPIIALSNGYILRIDVSIAATPDEVESIAYELHAAPGIQIISITYIGDVPGSKESVTLVNDGTANEYVVYTAVTLSAPKSGKTNRLSSASSDDNSSKVKVKGQLVKNDKMLDKDSAHGTSDDDLDLTLSPK